VTTPAPRGTFRTFLHERRKLLIAVLIILLGAGAFLLFGDSAALDQVYNIF
jgi:hypothetical protein